MRHGGRIQDQNEGSNVCGSNVVRVKPERRFRTRGICSKLGEEEQKWEEAVGKWLLNKYIPELACIIADQPGIQLPLGKRHTLSNRAKPTAIFPFPAVCSITPEPMLPPAGIQRNRPGHVNGLLHAERSSWQGASQELGRMEGVHDSD